MTRQRLGELLIERGVIDEGQLAVALQQQRSTRQKLGSILLDLEFATEDDVLSALASRLGYERVELDGLQLTPEVKEALRLVPEEFACSRGVVPVSCDGRTLTVAMRDPADLQAVDELCFRTGRHVRVLVAGEREIWRATARLYRRRGDLDLEVEPEPSTPTPIADLIVCSRTRARRPER